MAALDTLARQYDAYIRSDGRGFRRKARVLQSMWREEHDYPIGLHRGRPLGSRLAMPWARQTLNNYLLARVRQHTTAGWSTLVFDRYLDFATLGAG